MKLLKIISILMIYLVVTISFALYSPQPVSAAQQACCQKTKAGDFCRYTDVDECDSSFSISPNVYCDNIDFCKIGCCYDTEEGSCAQGVAKSACESKGSVFNPDPQCNIDQCRLGCCQISNQCSLSTQNKCRSTVSLYPGVEMIFHSSILTEQECIDTCRGIDEGACVSADGSCTRTIRAECQETFHQNKLCSHPELKTNCAPQQTTDCVGEDVYWFDSCGNKENIYNANKRASYNSGFIQKENQVPRAQPNDKNLGNCDYLTGTSCGEGNAKYGNYICKDINCYDVYQNSASPNSGGDKKMGESWCIYDTLPGPGKDTVGSRHRRHMCVNGDVIVEECADFREEICIQNKVGDEMLTDISVLTLISTDFQGYTEALCKPNRYEDCVSCPDATCCADINKDCIWVNYGHTGSSTINGMCIPIVPIGLKFWETGASECAKASQICTVEEVREIKLFEKEKWECRTNCHCLKHPWIVTANRYCKAMGDCGAYYNVEGKATLGGHSVNAWWQKLKLSDLEPWNSLSSPSSDAFYSYLSAQIEQYRSAANIKKRALTRTGVYAGTLAVAELITWGTLTPIFWIPVAFIIIVSLVKAFATKDRNVTYTFTCEPWEAPDGGADCKKCNNKDIECSEYLCKSLGKDCELINEGTDDQKCVAQPKTDVSSPVISPGDMDFDIEVQENGFRIKGLVKPFTPVILKINTNEMAQCKFSEQSQQKYEDMTYPFGSSSYLDEHELIIPVSSEAITEENLLATNGGRYTFYVKCRDANKNTNPKDYAIKFQIDPGPDQTPPSIEKTLPDNNAPIPFDSEEQEITILLNEPSGCKWSLTNKDFTQMENNFVCAETGLDFSSFYPGLYECKTTLKDIKKNQLNTFFFRCKDKSENIKQESYTYSLISTPPLQILSTKPEGKIYTRYPALEVTTIQGSDNGVATCGFNEQDVPLSNMLQMFNTDSIDHSQQLQPTQSGSYDYYVKCVDKAGNIAEDKISFNLEISLETAQIFNIYKDETLNILHISTTEDTTCEYSEQSFTYGTGTPMTQPDSKEHTTNLGLNVYYIICLDKFNNQASTIVYP